MADRYTFPPITAGVRSHASFDRVRAISPSLTERVSGSDLLGRRQLFGRRTTWATSRVEIRGLDLLEAGGVLGSSQRALA